MSDAQNNQIRVTGAGRKVPRKILLQELSLLLKRASTVVQLLPDASEDGPEGLPCHACSKAGCSTPCDRLEAYLDGPQHDRFHEERRVGANVGDIGGGQGGSERVAPHEQLKTGPIPVVPADNYLVNKDGHRQLVTAETAEQIRQRWSGDFLLDLPRQELRVRNGKRVRLLPFGPGGLPWRVQQVLMVGMSQPGAPFGFHTFSRRDPQGSGIGSARSLARYVCDLRRAIRGTGRAGQSLRKTSVESTESPSRWGYVFDKKWSYLVIATCPQKTASKFEDSTD